MPRKHRIHFPGALYHVISRGNNRQKVFFSADDYNSFLAALAKVRKFIPFSIHAYCLMPNHFHLLIEVGQHPLSEIMQRLLTSYTIRFNLSHKHHGHLFEGRYKAILCDKNSYLLELVRYIHLNPVKAKLVSDPAQWQWSSHSAYLGGNNFAGVETDQALAQFSSDRLAAAQNYAQFILDGIHSKKRNRLYPPNHSPFLGPPDFVAKLKSEMERPHPRTSRSITPSESLTKILHRVADMKSVEPSALRGPSRKRFLTEARKLFVKECAQAGHAALDIARFIKRSPTFVSIVSNS